MPRLADPSTAHTAALRLDAMRDVLSELRTSEQAQAELYARELRHRAQLHHLAAAADRPADAVLELAAAAGIGQDRAATQLDHGRRAVELYPHALDLLEAGRMLRGRMELLLWLTAKAPEPVQLELGRRILNQLGTLDAADARLLIRRTLLEVAAELDPDADTERQQQARANRGVWVKPVEDGMARIGAEVDQLDAQRFALDLEELVRAEKLTDERGGRQRTQAQRRTDVLAELPSRHLALLQAFQAGKTLQELVPHARDDEQWRAWSVTEIAAHLAAVPVRNPVTLYVHIPVSTVLDLEHRSGHVEGLGPISAYRARLLRPIASLARLWVDSRTGVPLGIDATADPPVGEPDWTDAAEVTVAAHEVRRRLLAMLRPTGIRETAEPGRSASARLTRFVRASDLTCTGPGCPMPATACELDHETAWADQGLTASWNLDLKSPRCHHARHAGWTPVRDPFTGDTTWTSPTGAEHTRRSPWRPPPPGPPDGTELPPPTLERADGGKPPAPHWAVERPLDNLWNTPDL